MKKEEQNNIQRNHGQNVSISDANYEKLSETQEQGIL